MSLRAVAIALVAIGFMTCVVPFAVLGYGMWQESQLTQRWSSAEEANLPLPPFVNDPNDGPGAARDPQPSPIPQSLPVAFAIRVPKIGYYAAVREGVSLDILATGPGHYPSTALPGRRGLVGIAAHNTFWIPFGQLGPGDLVVLETRYGRFSYSITGTRIVNPDDRTVLSPTPDPRLVLTTCWPLWAGNLAPQRLAIFAREV